MRLECLVLKFLWITLNEKKKKSWKDITGTCQLIAYSSLIVKSSLHNIVSEFKRETKRVKLSEN